ncbi:endonuclease/exonuclease/phosphatase family protein [Saccharospirillum impatiens]|uniref:endonuclease/exonuclease/phosphatase family protein n=1 Tax=Saccharospirillum impatiens TaxID=169438 RepID=UPI0003F6D5F8|nr:endonuclease/exonuclease/phosphatase family protein [Saccharospirillum impatiens]
MDRFRLATYNVALNRPHAGDLVAELNGEPSAQVSALLQVMASVDAQVWVINELDYDPEQRALSALQAQLHRAGMDFPHVYTAPVNTGVPSGRDLVKQDENQTQETPFGFGDFPGQYGMAVLSAFPLNVEHCRTFQTFLWRDMPSALLPARPDGSAFYTDDDLAVLRLSSKSHWDLPVALPCGLCHLLISHPTPPAFDGPERRNVCRNHDEIRFWVDYINGASYMTDDRGHQGGLAPEQAFIVAGDLNASPTGGDSQPGAISSLVNHSAIHTLRPLSDRGDDLTARWRLRADYVLPSTQVPVIDTGVFWPGPGSPLNTAVEQASDHRPVWIDITVPDRL